VPGYLQNLDQLKKKGVNEIWCVATNDAFVMGAWGEHTGAAPTVRMLSDGHAEFTRALGLSLDLSAKGLGQRSQRYAMWVVDGVVQALHVDASGALQTSDATTLLADLEAARA
jgi:peroxiredoxin